MGASPLMTAGAAVAQAFRIEERVEAMAGALLSARAFVAGLQHPADPEASDLLALIDRTLSREPKIAYRGWWIGYEPPPLSVRTCDWMFFHADFDGAEDSADNRFGHAASLGEAIAEIDEREARS